MRDAMTAPRVPIRLPASVDDALSLIAAHGALVLAVIDDKNLFAGIVTRARLESGDFLTI